MLTLPPIQKQFNTVINPSNTTQTIIFSPPIYSLEKWGYSLNNCVIERRLYNTVLTVNLVEFPLNPFPESLTTEFMSKFEQDTVIKNSEWLTNNRLNCEILIRETSASSWMFKATSTISNRDGIPYTHPNFGAALNPNVQGYVTLDGQQELAIKLIDCGAGLLRGSDRLAISGQLTEVCYVRDDSSFITNTQNIMKLVSPEGTKIATLPSNTAWFLYRNNGTARIWINYGQFVGIGFGEALEPGEASRLDNLPYNAYKFSGDIWAVTEGENSQPLSAILTTV